MSPTEHEHILPTTIPAWQQKINPVWWLKNGDSFDAPVENNGQPYLTEVTNPLLRSFYWWWRNPFANFVGFVIGVEDRERDVLGTVPIKEATMWDHGAHGWKWMLTIAPSWQWMIAFSAICFAGGFFASIWFVPLAAFTLMLGTGLLPFVSYSGEKILFYVGWRYSGGFGVKINKGHTIATSSK